jgi:hypothetical protein
MNYLSIVILLTYCFSQEFSFPKENLQNLGQNWYQVTSWIEIHDDITSAQAKEKTINQAFKTIIEFYSGIEISSRSLSILAETNLEIEIDHFSQIINSMSTGVILEKKILKEEKQLIDGFWIYVITLQAKVGKLKGENDPFFKLEAKLNRDNYQHGDKMTIEITSTKDCYIYVFNIWSDETVGMLLPNQYMDENFLGKGKTLQFPPKEGKISGFKVGLLENTTQATEMIIVLAIKAEKIGVNKDFNLTMGNYKMAMTELMEFIMKFPREKIEQVSLSYVITSKK